MEIQNAMSKEEILEEEQGEGLTKEQEEMLTKNIVE